MFIVELMFIKCLYVIFLNLYIVDLNVFFVIFKIFFFVFILIVLIKIFFKLYWKILIFSKNKNNIKYYNYF